MSNNTIPIKALLTAGVVTAATLLTPATASADPGCRTDFWWTWGSTQRTICDTPRAADGTWVRYREFWTPAHNVPLRTYCSGGRYYSSCSTTGGYWQPRTSKGIENYPVNDSNVLPDEPGWLPAGTDVLR